MERKRKKKKEKEREIERERKREIGKSEITNLILEHHNID